MHASWQNSAEQIMLAAIDNKARVVGIVSPDRQAGVSTLCRQLAEAYAASGARTLLIDLAERSPARGAPKWRPGFDAAMATTATGHGFDLLVAQFTSESRALFSNVTTFRGLLDDNLASYEAIVIDLPALGGSDHDSINPVAAARACDAVLLLCLTGKVTQDQLMAAVREMQGAGVPLAGTVLNDRYAPTLGVAMATNRRRLSRLVPGLNRWVERKLSTSEFLNTRL
jgi:Mrp family chromosome partitioning ATPase